MPDLSLDLRYLRYALAVAEQGSFRRAALKLDLPQSTISRRVKQLESRLGISIFDRDHSGVRLTSAGQRFVDDALVGAQHFANALGAMHAIRRGQGGHLRLGIFTSLRNDLLRLLVGEYHRRHPAIECHFVEGDAQTLVGGVLNGRLDIAFVTGSPNVPRCQSNVLGEERLYVAQQQGNVMAPPETRIELASLRKRQFIVTKGGRGPDIENFLISQLSAPGFRPNVQVHDVSFETLLHMVELGFGVAVVSEGAASSDRDLLFSALDGSESVVKSSAIWLTSNTNPALRPLIVMAQQMVAK